MPPTQISVDGVVPRGELTLTVRSIPTKEPPGSGKRAGAAKIKNCEDIAIFAALYLFLVGMVVVCLYFGVFATAVPPETQRWSQSILAAILSGTVSFMVGRKMGK